MPQHLKIFYDAVGEVGIVLNQQDIERAIQAILFCCDSANCAAYVK